MPPARPFARRFILAASLMAYSALAVCQAARDTEFMGQPLIYAKDGKLHGCGVRVFAVETGYNSDQSMLAIDGSMQLDLRMGGIMVKMTAQKATSEAGKLKRQGPATIERAWFRADTFAPTTAKGGKVLPTQEPIGGVLYLAEDMQAGMNILLAIASGKTIELGMKLKGETGDTVRFGPVKLSPTESERFQSCMNDLLAEGKK